MRKIYSLIFLLCFSVCSWAIQKPDHGISSEAMIQQHRAYQKALKERLDKQTLVSVAMSELREEFEGYDKIMKKIDEGRQGTQQWLFIGTSIADIIIDAKNLIDKYREFQLYVNEHASKNPLVMLMLSDCITEVKEYIERSEFLLALTTASSASSALNLNFLTMTNKQRIELVTQIKNIIYKVKIIVSRKFWSAKLLVGKYRDPIKLVLNSKTLENSANAILNSYGNRLK